MKRVVLAAGLYPPDIGGPATYAKMLADGFPSRGVDVAVVPFGSVRRFPKILRHILYTDRLIRRGRKADVILAFDPISTGVPALLAARILRTRFVLRVGGDYAWEQSAQRFGVREDLDTFVECRGTYPLAVGFLQALQSFVARRAEKVIVPSRYLKGIVEKWGVSPERVVVVYNAFNPVTVEESKETFAKELRMPHPALLSAARLVPWKGMRALIGTLPGLARDFPDIGLVIAGDGPERSALEAYAATVGVSERVQFLGSLPRTELYRHIKAADLFVLNTGYEGFSHQLLEVMSIGTPIITTDVGGNPELIEDGVEGTLVSYDDVQELEAAVRAILKDFSRRERLTSAARTKAASFTAERMLDETLRALRTE